MSSVDFDSALDDCLTRIQNGEAIDACLADYAEQAEQLRPLLNMGQTMQTIHAPAQSSNSVTSGHEKMLAALAQKKQSQHLPVSVSIWRRYATRLSTFFIPKEMTVMKLIPRVAIALFATLFIGSWLVVTTSANNLPGDTLYPVKRSWESVQQTLTFNPTAREALKEQHQRNRESEIKQLIDLNRSEKVQFSGYLEWSEQGKLKIGNYIVLITDETVFNQTAVIGDRLFVTASLSSDGTLQASSITVTKQPTPAPTQLPTMMPTSSATILPTHTVTMVPTQVATYLPTTLPTHAATQMPTAQPTLIPTQAPTYAPTYSPTQIPTSVPTYAPTLIPTSIPTQAPTYVSTSVPTQIPTNMPTTVPTQIPTNVPTPIPTQIPTTIPTEIPTIVPTQIPTVSPTP